MNLAFITRLIKVLFPLLGMWVFRAFCICLTCPTDAGWSVCLVKDLLLVVSKVYFYLFSDEKKIFLFDVRLDY